ncbi:MAG: DUF5020 family protein [Fidelibacterota bacterium]
MKRIPFPDRVTLLFIPLLFAPSVMHAQFNLQHHYDIRRQIFTSTAEFLFHDTLGTTFGFMDINYDTHHYTKPGATDVYFEVARYFRVPRIHEGLRWTIQVNDGVIFFPATDSTLFSAVNRAWLGGFSYRFPLENLLFSVDLLARLEQGGKGLGNQVTVVWFLPLGERWISTGFFDLWNSGTGGSTILLTEPQLLYILGKWQGGVEVEISRNFPGAWTREEPYRPRKVWFLPTLFLRYTF